MNQQRIKSPPAKGAIEARLTSDTRSAASTRSVSLLRLHVVGRSMTGSIGRGESASAELRQPPRAELNWIVAAS